MNENICKKAIYYGAFLRITSTLATFYLLYKFLNPSYLLIVLPIVLSMLDSLDNIFFYNFSWVKGFSKTKCSELFEYQFTDKINDWFSYLIAYYVFNLDSLFLGFLIWRGLGVAAFGLTRSSTPLILMFDMMKEYLVFKYFSPNSNRLLPVIILLKMCFEFIFHKLKNKPNYP